jgi:hypothetical protein
MFQKTRFALPITALLFAIGIPLSGQAANPYQETGAQIQARQRVADLTPGPRREKPRFASPRQRRAVSPSPALSAPPLHGVPSSGEPQTLGVNFLGANLADTNTYPPDTMGAAGPSQFLVGVNSRLRSFDKVTGAADGGVNADLDVFFASVRNNEPTSEPRVRYDRLSGRWFVTALTFSDSLSNNRVVVAVSSSETISIGTIWAFYYFEHDLDLPVDDPTLGVDSNGLVIGGNLFDTTGVYQGTSVHVVRKSQVLSGAGGDLVVGGSVVAYRNLTTTPGGPGPYSPQGVDRLTETSPAESWVIGVNNQLPVTNQLVLRKITFSAPGAWPPSSISANLMLSVPATALPLTVPHLGNTGGADGQLDALDDRLFDAKLRGGHIWTAHNIAVDATGAGSDAGDRDGARWYEIDITGAPALVQSGTLFDTAATNPRFYWIPSIMVSGQGHAAIGASAAGATQYINGVTAGRFASDPAGELQAPLLFTASTTPYNPPADPGPARRWGDYSFTSLDPNDDMTMWTIQEYCNANDSYGVRVVQLIAPGPATPSSATPPNIASGQASVSVVIDGTSSGGSGFFDPGAGYPNRLAAAIGNGVTVNGVSYTSPTSVTLDLNTVGAPFGPRSVTITNPDGQSRTSAAPLLTLGAGGPGPTVTAIAPTSGDAAAANPFTVSGTDFVSGASISIGGVAATGVDVTGPTAASAATAALSPGTLNDVTLVNPDTQSATLFSGWFADFVDVPQADIFHAYVENIFRNGITAGCVAGSYCRDAAVTRAQMAVFLLKSKFGAGHVPPACGQLFADVACPSLFADWIEELYTLGVTGGCQVSPLSYCPDAPVTRAQMAAFLLKASLGSSYAPPNCSGLVFTDVPCTGGIFDPWIEDLASRGITGGCGAGAYCPDASNTRGQMAVFLVKTFSLP